MDLDIKNIKQLVQLMVDNDLSRVELHEGDNHLLLRRGQSIVASGPAFAAPPAAPTPPPAPAQQPAPAAAPAAGAKPSPPPAADEKVIRSPMVGTFYASPDPESPPFINIGDEVTADTVVCLIEAMKVFNEIKAETAGRITKILVKNGEAVEFDQPLFAIG